MIVVISRDTTQTSMQADTVMVSVQQDKTPNSITKYVVFHTKTSKDNEVLPYSSPSVGPRADPSVQAVSPQVTISHPPAVGCHYFQPGLRFTFVNVHQMAPPLTEVTDI